MDPNQNTSTTDIVSTTEEGHQSCGTASRVITIGGITGSGDTNSVEELVERTTTSPIPDLPSSLRSHSATVLPGSQELLVCGGHGLVDTSMTSCSSYTDMGWKTHSYLWQVGMIVELGYKGTPY